MADEPTTTDALMAYFQLPIVAITRERDAAGSGEWVTLTFEAGGQVKILTRNPLVWVQPESH